MRIFRTKICFVAKVFIIVNFLGIGHVFASPCLTLGSIKIPGVDVVSANEIPSGNFHAPDGNNYTIVEFCRITAIARPTEDSNITIEVWLPLKDWNGRFYQVGTGGFAGRIVYPMLSEHLMKGSAVAATDMGHKADGSDASWALKRPEMIIDYGYRGLFETTRTAQAITQRFYGKSPDYNYFAGCSNGGREALMMAQRYPEYWDGILAGAPANFLTLTEHMKVSNERALQSSLDSHIPHSKLPEIQKASLDSCTDRAYVYEDIATDPRFCKLDPSKLICKGEESDSCLTVAQAKALKKIYSGPVNPETGEAMFFGLAPTFEASDGWKEFVFSTEKNQTTIAKLGYGFFANMVLDDPKIDIYTMDMVEAINSIKEKSINGQTLQSILQSDSTDLSKFKSKGGKLLMYFGWGDEFLPPEGGIKYYEDVVNNMGGLVSTQSFFRLFMVPGMLHCTRGSGANSFGQYPTSPAKINDADHDVVKALEHWVESDKAPNKLVAAKYINDNADEGVAFTRMLCPYPKVPIYNDHLWEGESEDMLCRGEHNLLDEE